MAILRIHSFGYVLSFEPHTGAFIFGHNLKHLRPICKIYNVGTEINKSLKSGSFDQEISTKQLKP